MLQQLPMRMAGTLRVLSFGAACAALSACGSDEGGGSGPARIDVVLVATTDAFPHADTSSGQTAEEVSAGVRSLTLLSDSGEAWPLVHRGTTSVVVRYDDGARSMLGSVLARDVVFAHYTRARMVQEWSRFDVQATLHDAGATAGTLSALHVTSDGTTIDGELRNAGHYVHDFTGGTKTGQWSGDDATVPEHSTTAGAEALMEDGEWAVYFPVDLEIASGDGTLTIVVNMHQAFRWQDVPGGDNQPGVWDIAPPLYEPVLQFGGNRFEATFQPR